jgi:hypothetical protein
MEAVVDNEQKLGIAYQTVTFLLNGPKLCRFALFSETARACVVETSAGSSGAFTFFHGNNIQTSLADILAGCFNDYPAIARIILEVGSTPSDESLAVLKATGKRVLMQRTSCQIHRSALRTTG